MTADPGTGSTLKKNSTPGAIGPRPIRWWPAAVILLLAGGAVLWVRSVYGRNHQEQNIATANILIVSFLLLLLWWLLWGCWRRLPLLGRFTHRAFWRATRRHRVLIHPSLL